MDNGQMPPVQSAQPIGQSVPYQTVSGQPMVQQVKVAPAQKKDISGLVKIIVIIILSLTTATFVGLFIWMFMQYNTVQTDVNGQIAAAVAVAKDEQIEKDETEFAEREKYPFKTFSGPVDYGELSFEYPKTWSVYVAADATNGGDYEAYLNPGQVDPINKTNINALRVTVLDKSFDEVTASYQRYLDSKDKNLSVESVTVNGVTANLYSGVIPSTDFNGYILIFKIRDKTAVLQTDSVLFKQDFDKLIETITFNA